MANAMKYTHDASTVDPASRANPAADQTCANCALIQGNDGQPREYQTNISVVVNWIDNRGNAIRDTRSVALPPDIVELVGVGNAIYAVLFAG